MVVKIPAPIMLATTIATAEDAIARLGTAFQIVDDVLDATEDTEHLGKTPGKDAQEHRCTWVAFEGVEAAMNRFNAG